MAWETTRTIHGLYKAMEDLPRQEGSPTLQCIDRVLAGIRATICGTVAYGSAAAVDLCRIPQECCARLFWKKRP